MGKWGFKPYSDFLYIFISVEKSILNLYTWDELNSSQVKDGFVPNVVPSCSHEILKLFPNTFAIAPQIYPIRFA
jgi:hypothetical protein